jgi:hypothetical protein
MGLNNWQLTDSHPETKIELCKKLGYAGLAIVLPIIKAHADEP